MRPTITLYSVAANPVSLDREDALALPPGAIVRVPGGHRLRVYREYKATDGRLTLIALWGEAVEG
jgi:hypothetical protein